MKVLLLHLDGKLPNLALMRIAAHHSARGDEVELRHAPNVRSVERGFWDGHDRVYASLIFEKSRPIARRLLQVRPDAIVGGTGWDVTGTLEDRGINPPSPDYSVYPKWQQSIGFTQRGCRLKCPFCVVRLKEPELRADRTIAEIWRSEPWPRELILLDNDFFGLVGWQDRIAEMRAGGFKVCFSQGINARFLDEETAAAVASVDYRDDSMKVRRIYTAWDNRKDEARLFRGLDALAAAGVKPDHIMVYILVGYWDGPRVTPDDLFRRDRLREFGARPYPMPYVRTPETVGFQRWVVGAYDKRIAWADWVRAGYNPRRLGHDGDPTLFDGGRP